MANAGGRDGSVAAPRKPVSALLNVQQPEPLDMLSPDLEEAWNDFWSEFELFTEVTELANRPEPTKKTTFVMCLGQEARR